MKTIILTLTYLSVTFFANAQSGFLDKTFGDTGFVLQPKGFYCRYIAIQSDTKIIAGIKTINGLAVIRYMPDGEIDYSFGDSGFAVIPVSFEAAAIVISSEGKLIALAGGGTANPNVILTAFASNGTIDSSFGKNGVSTADFGKIELAKAIQLQSDGKILVMGTQITDITNPDPNIFIARFNADGSVDNSFGQKGLLVNNSFIAPRPISMAIQKDNKILVGASTYTEAQGDAFIFWRYNEDGILDNSFGNGGSTTSNYSKYDDAIFSLAVQPDGKIVAAGLGGQNYFVPHIPGDMLFTRYNSDGSIDETFGNAGSVIVNFGKQEASQVNTVLIDETGNIIGVGETYDDGENNPLTEIALTRLTNRGKIDSAFGNNGIQITSYEGYIYPGNSVLQGDKIISGNANYLNGYRPLLARYNNTTQKQILISKIKRWLQHHNGITWDGISNISSYFVQRSYDGIHFSSIAKINIGNNSNYTYADPVPLSGNNYYRLQTTSTNGSVNYSNVLAITADEDAIKISPNPAKNSLHIEGLSSNKTKLTVVDFTGNIKLQAVAKNTSYNFNIASLTTGNYLLKIEMNNEIITRKFVKE